MIFHPQIDHVLFNWETFLLLLVLQEDIWPVFPGEQNSYGIIIRSIVRTHLLLDLMTKRFEFLS